MSPASPVFNTVESVRLSINSKEILCPALSLNVHVRVQSVSIKKKFNTIIAVTINHNVWIKYTISFSVGTLFQYGSSNPVPDSSQTIKERPSLTKI